MLENQAFVWTKSTLKWVFYLWKPYIKIFWDDDSLKDLGVRILSYQKYIIFIASVLTVIYFSNYIERRKQDSNFLT